MAKSDLLAVRGVGEATAEKLINAGIESIEQLATESVENIVNISGFPISRVIGILQSASELMESQADVTVDLQTTADPDQSGGTKEKKSKKKAKKQKKKKDKGSKKKDDRGKKKKDKKKSKKKAKKKKK
jgi:hypothetical protein